MALTLLNDLKPYDPQFRTGYMETIDYVADIFNQKSFGTINLESEFTEGLGKKFAYWKQFGKMSHRDHTVQTAQTSGKIERDEHTAFKTFWKFEPIEFTWSAFKTSDKMSDGEVALMMGRVLAERQLEYSVQQALTIASYAIESNNDLVLDLATGGSNFTMDKLIHAKSLFGDGAYRFKAIVMHSAVSFPYTKDAVLNYKFDSGAGFVIYGGTPATFGLPMIITDNPELTYEVGGETFYKTLLLTDSAVTVSNNGNTQALMDTISGQENIASIFQAEGDMWNYIKGYQLKSTAGTNPDYSTLATAANWEQWVTDRKLTAGVLIKSAANLDLVSQILNVRVIS